MLLAFLIFHINFIFAQINVENDTAYIGYQGSLTEEIDRRFLLEKHSDFELELHISHSKMINSRIFILTQKNNKWVARLFEKNYQADTLFEITIQQTGLEKLWKDLNKNKILAIPRETDLRDKKGKEIDLLIHHGTRYFFALKTPAAKRSYSYSCPRLHSKKYKYIKAYTRISNIISLVFKHCGIKQNYIC